MRAFHHIFPHFMRLSQKLRIFRLLRRSPPDTVLFVRNSYRKCECDSEEMSPVLPVVVRIASPNAKSPALGLVGSFSYTAMEFVPGKTLDQGERYGLSGLHGHLRAPMEFFPV